MATEGGSKPIATAIFSGSRERRARIALTLNRCPHGISTVMSRCSTCDELRDILASGDFSGDPGDEHFKRMAPL